MPTEPSARILLGNGLSRTSLLKMMEIVDVLYYACRSTKCTVGHPSKSRRISKPSFRWISRSLKMILSSRRSAVIEITPIEDNEKFIRTLSPCVRDPDGRCEWDIIIESMGLVGGITLVGLV